MKRNKMIQCFLAGVVIMVYSHIAWSSDNGAEVGLDKEFVVDVKDAVTVSSGSITVGDVAVVNGRNIDAAILIDDVVLGRAPWPGNSRSIGVGEIMLALRNSAVDLSKVQFVGADDVTVSVRATRISGAQIASYAEERLRRKLDISTGRVVVELRRVPDDQLVPLGNGDVRLKFDRISSSKSGRQAYISARIVVDGIVFKTIGISFTVKRFEDIVVARDDMRQGRVVTAKSLAVESVEVTQLSGSTFRNIDDVTGHVVKSSIRSGQIITDKLLADIVTVKKGDVVTLLIRNGGLEVRSSGVCQEDGANGDVVRVVNAVTKKLLYGSVLDSSIVEVQG